MITVAGFNTAIDRRIDLDQLMPGAVQRAHAVDAGPWLVKPNADEASMLAGTPVNDVVSAVACVHALHRRGVACQVVTLGVEGAVDFDGDAAWHAYSEPVEARNSVGSGDCFLAAMAVGAVRKESLDTMLSYAVACGVVNAAREETGLADAARVRTWLPRVHLQPWVVRCGHCGSQRGVRMIRRAQPFGVPGPALIRGVHLAVPRDDRANWMDASAGRNRRRTGIAHWFCHAYVDLYPGLAIGGEPSQCIRPPWHLLARGHQKPFGTLAAAGKSLACMQHAPLRNVTTTQTSALQDAPYRQRLASFRGVNRYRKGTSSAADMTRKCPTMRCCSPHDLFVTTRPLGGVPRTISGHLPGSHASSVWEVAAKRAIGIHARPRRRRGPHLLWHQNFGHRKAAVDTARGPSQLSPGTVDLLVSHVPALDVALYALGHYAVYLMCAADRVRRTAPFGTWYTVPVDNASTITTRCRSKATEYVFTARLIATTFSAVPLPRPLSPFGLDTLSVISSFA